MSAEKSVYLKVFVWLAALTAVEIAITYAPVSKLIINSALVLFSLAKAALVAMFFMHLKFERRTLSLFALAPLVLSVLLLISLLPDLSSSAKVAGDQISQPASAAE
jgi:cytochrome c oxidase subunit 4